MVVVLWETLNSKEMAGLVCLIVTTIDFGVLMGKFFFYTGEIVYSLLGSIIILGTILENGM
jgi:hypothetical protein